MLLPLPDAEVLDPGGGVNENETVHLALGRYPCMIADRFRAGNLELSPPFRRGDCRSERRSH